MTPNSRSWCANRTALHPEDYVCVGIPGFEPGTPCSQSRCANRTALHPELLAEVCFSIAMQRYGFFLNPQVFRVIFFKKRLFSLFYLGKVGFYFFNSCFKATILMAVTAHSSPLLPKHPPARSSACCMLLVVIKP